MQDNKEIGKQTQQGDHRGEKAGMGLGGMDGRVLCGFDCSHKNEESPDSRGHGAAESAGDVSRRKVQQRADRLRQQVRVKR